MNITHKELIFVAEKFLRKYCKCGVVFTELKTAVSEIPDAMGFQSCSSFLVECKMSRADFLCDKKKPFRKDISRGMGNFRFYLSPAGVIMPSDLPDKWGLVWVTGDFPNINYLVKVNPYGNINRCDKNLGFEPSLERERRYMYSALRRLELRGRIKEIYEPLN